MFSQSPFLFSSLLNVFFSQNLSFVTVTVGWWDDLWLNEGFASYIEYKGTNAVHPDWDIVR